MADSEDGGDVGEVGPPETASPVVEEPEQSLPTPATEGELVKAGDGSVSSNPEGLSLNYEVRNVVHCFSFLCFVLVRISELFLRYNVVI
jgi:hypothetical protein